MDEINNLNLSLKFTTLNSYTKIPFTGYAHIYGLIYVLLLFFKIKLAELFLTAQDRKKKFQLYCSSPANSQDSP